MPRRGISFCDTAAYASLRRRQMPEASAASATPGASRHAHFGTREAFDDAGFKLSSMRSLQQVASRHRLFQWPMTELFILWPLSK